MVMKQTQFRLESRLPPSRGNGNFVQTDSGYAPMTGLAALASDTNVGLFPCAWHVRLPDSAIRQSDSYRRQSAFPVPDNTVR